MQHRTYFIALSIILITIVYLSTNNNPPNAKLLQGGQSSNRRLDWYFIQTLLKSDQFYTWYDWDEIPENVTKVNSPTDFLRDTDVCPDPINQTYSLENCPPPPDCSKVKQKWGEAVLCIQRTPFPWDLNKFYVSAMNCKPIWENCDRCQCGIVKGIGGKNEYCIFKGTNHQIPDDDRWSLDCHNPVKLSVRTESKGMLDFTPFSYMPTISMSPSSSKPTFSPSETSSLTPSALPTFTPTSSYQPTISPTITKSESPSISPTTSSPTITKSEPPSLSPTTALPTFVPTSNAPTDNPSVTPSETLTLAFIDVEAFLSESDTDSSGGNDEGISKDYNSLFQNEVAAPVEDDYDIITVVEDSNNIVSSLGHTNDTDNNTLVSSQGQSSLDTNVDNNALTSTDGVTLLQIALFALSAICFGSFIILGVYWSFISRKREENKNPVYIGNSKKPYHRDRFIYS